ncbi:MAG: cytochrome C oxidase subunit IV family protein [Pseudoxanthomonas sp.]
MSEQNIAGSSSALMQGQKHAGPSRTTIIVVWALLVGSTVISFAMGNDAIHLDSKLATTAFVVSLMTIKILLIGVVFMELMHSSKALLIGFLAFCVAVTAVLTGIYL